MDFFFFLSDLLNNRQRIFNSLRILLLITVKAKSSNAIISIISCASTIIERKNKNQRNKFDNLKKSGKEIMYMNKNESWSELKNTNNIGKL
jgi:hypothetical protein